MCYYMANADTNRSTTNTYHSIRNWLLWNTGSWCLSHFLLASPLASPLAQNWVPRHYWIHGAPYKCSVAPCFDAGFLYSQGDKHNTIDYEKYTDKVLTIICFQWPTAVKGSWGVNMLRKTELYSKFLNIIAKHVGIRTKREDPILHTIVHQQWNAGNHIRRFRHFRQVYKVNLSRPSHGEFK